LADYPIIDIDKPKAPLPACPRGNPIFPFPGVKREQIDIGFTVGPHRVALTYDSSGSVPFDQAASEAFPDPRAGNAGTEISGTQWHGSLDRRLLVQGTGLYKGVLAARGDGRVISFKGTTGSYGRDADVNDLLVAVSGGYHYRDTSSGSLELYDFAGRLQSIRSARGSSLIYTYSDALTPIAIAPGPGYLIGVVDQFGRRLDFEYGTPQAMSTGVRLLRITDSAGRQLPFSYDGQGRLTGLTWQDGASRTFHYESAGLPLALTGVTDEAAGRLSTFGYDGNGRAISTERAGGVNRFAVAYATSPPIVSVLETYVPIESVIYRRHQWSLPGSATLTSPLAVHTIVPSVILGRQYESSTDQPGGSGCAASTSVQTHDANGNVANRDDFNGTRACYGYDSSRNLETTRVEGLVGGGSGTVCSTVTGAGAALPVGSRKVSTQWHPDWRLASKVAEPGRITTSIYNGQSDPFNGNAIASCAAGAALLPDGKPIAVLCKKVEQATVDTDGSQGFGAALQAGIANRVEQWTYNQYGQVLTHDGPRTDVSDVTTYAYYSSTTADYTLGDLQSMTNAAGKVTQYTKYNKHGQVLEMIDPNGVVTTHTYDLRLRLLSTTVGGQTTSHEYWPTGLLKKTTSPDTSFVSYEYDDAHRLRAVANNLGHRIEYTLDNAGNRTAEVVKDPGGVLRRQLSRSIDALGRVQQLVGRE